MYRLQRGFLVVTLFFCSATLFVAQEGRWTRSRTAAAAKQKAERLHQEAERSCKNELRSSLPCLEELPAQLPQNSLAELTEHWPVLIEYARAVCKQGKIITGTHCGSTIACMRVPNLKKLQYKWQELEDSFYVMLIKNIKEGKVEFQDYYKRFVAEDVGIQSTGTFLNPAIASGIKIVSLEHNNLTSFTEIQEKIIAQCPLLKTLKLGYNQLTGELWIEHKNIAEFSVTHNRFSLLGKIRLPNAHAVDFSFNAICFNNTPDAEVSALCCFDIGNNRGIEIESMILEEPQPYHTAMIFSSVQIPKPEDERFIDTIFNM